MSAPTEYEQVTYRGRQICQSRELGSGYCGSGPLDVHVAQMRDPESWVHSSKADWYRAGMELYRSTLTLLSRFAVFMVAESCAQITYRAEYSIRGVTVDIQSARGEAFAALIHDGLLRVTWSQP